MIKPNKKCRTSLNTGYKYLIIYPSSLLIIIKKKVKQNVSEFSPFVTGPLGEASDWEKQTLR